MFRVGIIILLSLFLASCLGGTKHYRQYSNKGLSLAEAKSFCNSEGNVDRIAARDSSAAAREAQRSSRPRNYDITGVRIGDQVHGTVRERPQASGGFATGAMNSLGDNLAGMFAKRKAVRRCMMNLGYVETEAPSGNAETDNSIGMDLEGMKKLGERDLCQAALDPVTRNWRFSGDSSQLVFEARQKGLSLSDCRKAMGLGYVETEAPTLRATNFSSYTTATLCGSALGVNDVGEMRSWTIETHNQNYVDEVQRRGLSIADCRKAMGL